MGGNGDERTAAAWERVEAKLDRLGEVQADQGQTLARLDRRLSRVEGELDLVKLLLESVRREVDRKMDRLKDEPLTALGREQPGTTALRAERGSSVGTTTIPSPSSHRCSAA